MIAGGLIGLLKKDFVRGVLKSQGVKISPSFKEYDLDPSVNNYSALLNLLVRDGKVNFIQVMKAAEDEILFSINTNIYLTKVTSLPKIKKSDLNDYIRKFKDYGISVSSLDNLMSLKNNSTKEGNKELALIKYEEHDGYISKLNIAISEGIEIDKGNNWISKTNNYLVTEIDFTNEHIIFRVKNWSSYADRKHIPDIKIVELKRLIMKIFEIGYIADNRYGKFIHSYTNKITDNILKSVYTHVDDKILPKTTIFVNDTWNEMFPDVGQLAEVDKSIMIKSIQNTFYGTYFNLKYGKVSPSEFIEKLNVKEYIRSIVFKDDTSSIGKAKSKDRYESLYNTSVFYDLLARFRNSTIVDLATIYWIQDNGKSYGTSFYGNNNGMLKIIFLEHRIEKGKYDYVLSQVIRDI